MASAGGRSGCRAGVRLAQFAAATAGVALSGGMAAAGRGRPHIHRRTAKLATAPEQPPAPPAAPCRPIPRLASSRRRRLGTCGKDAFYWNERVGSQDFVNEYGPLTTLGYFGAQPHRAVPNGTVRGTVAYDGGAQFDDGSYEPYSRFVRDELPRRARREYDLLIEPPTWSRARMFVGIGTRFWMPRSARRLYAVPGISSTAIKKTGGPSIRYFRARNEGVGRAGLEVLRLGPVRTDAVDLRADSTASI